ncbi:hypothetical protein [Okeania sp. SIO2B3]|uniref:hypothetical protein n=1 Tax=Okeania sp. SIO2B3 TaxID=2607784 RepID=UPI0013BF44C5|nr:hypothetical protein [Okeania sp. SIO2B3]NET46472.1 hypothetical protein [Okeania sp. SIO2B3]
MPKQKTSIFSTLMGSSVLTTGLVVSSAFIAPATQAFTLTEDPACNVAAAVFNPQYDDCKGAYELAGGENDVTDGGPNNIATQLLNNDDIFGTEDWTFLGKDDGNGTSFFTVNGINSTSGEIVFDTAAIENVYGPTFTQNYDIAVSFKAAKNFSIYQWDAGLGTNTIDWTTDGTATNKQGVTQGLSHASVYFRYKEIVDPPRARVPESTSMLTLGLIGGRMFLSRRRKNG